MSEVFTTTLQSGDYLTISRSFDAGELLLAKLLLALLALVILDITFRLVYRR
jgi:hypothetical protein